jgi:hypothetical protein
MSARIPTVVDEFLHAAQAVEQRGIRGVGEQPLEVLDDRRLDVLRREDPPCDEQRHSASGNTDRSRL